MYNYSIEENQTYTPFLIPYWLTTCFPHSSRTIEKTKLYKNFDESKKKTFFLLNFNLLSYNIIKTPCAVLIYTGHYVFYHYLSFLFKEKTMNSLHSLLCLIQ